jgi:hypothetical protein
VKEVLEVDGRAASYSEGKLEALRTISKGILSIYQQNFTNAFLPSSFIPIRQMKMSKQRKGSPSVIQWFRI